MKKEKVIKRDVDWSMFNRLTPIYQSELFSLGYGCGNINDNTINTFVNIFLEGKENDISYIKEKLNGSSIITFSPLHKDYDFCQRWIKKAIECKLLLEKEIEEEYSEKEMLDIILNEIQTIKKHLNIE